jgi:hypothetical protein
LLWSTQNLKEPLTIFLLVLCFWAFISFLSRWNPLYLILALVLIVLLHIFRPPFDLFAGSAFFLHICFLGYRKTKQKHLLIFIVALIGCLFYFKFENNIANFFNPSGSGKLVLSKLLSKIDYARNVRAYSKLAILPKYQMTQLKSSITYMPIGVLVVLFAPFPWQLFSTSQIFAAPEMVMWYIMLPFLLRGIFFVSRNKAKYFISLFICLLFTVIFLGMIEGNIGTLFRHRSVLIEFCLIFTAIGISLSKEVNRANEIN